MGTRLNCYILCVVKVPLDAYVMDFVFSEREDGGIFDNKNGMDYHISVFGGVVKEPPIHIVHIAVEMAPIAKVGLGANLMRMHIEMNFFSRGGLDICMLWKYTEFLV